MKELFLAQGRFWMAVAIATSVSFIPIAAQAQFIKDSGQSGIEAAQPRFTSPTAPAVAQTSPTSATISRDQAPLPLSAVLETPIEQFEPAFADVSTDHWAYEAVTRLFYSGIVSGYATE
ncbi:S-layer homology domain-containing protein [Oculatella sp. FACHB-28]|uniref:S-layer homology domain-containing protein n=1 Tax=Cyanophyceae TaxID=3028117 RepID=UPI001687FEA4|nr:MULTISPECIES: S-layer homology domain-containing protein [Cyanophyceae]MBD2058550.1 S-layer homology domain-containing protein [Oculatella sp. FACHB-28]MBD2066562.1 S-layer homology domain-containing protein [Leptolyngbya sp. FACHB-671]